MEIRFRLQHSNTLAFCSNYFFCYVTTHAPATDRILRVNQSKTMRSLLPQLRRLLGNALQLAPTNTDLPF